ncbi:hypothetical protein [Streptomyces sp. 8N616]|uniref:hypothetical protein n=1 Tax=Streptomyces sp. 8N616 TaxID=3457414 RepID=UPI003FD43886
MNMIEPGGIPQFTGDLEQLEKDVSGLRGDAIGIRNGGMDVHSRFQMLEAFYKAPEAEQLFATTLPVRDKADTFAGDLEAVADALDTFATEVRPLVKRLAQLKVDAAAFVDSVESDDEWTYDEDKVNRHQELRDGVSAAVAAFQEAERRAAGKISALVGGPKFVVDDGSHTQNRKTVMYGYDLDVLKHAEELPWGAAVTESHHAWEIGYHLKSFVWDGLVIDNIWGGIQGLGTLVGVDGADAAGDAWGHLGDIVGGIGQYTMTPYDALMDWTFGEEPDSPAETRQKQAAKDFGKALVAWDKWEENPARASATVVFNVLTLGAGPLAAAAKGGKAGAAAKGAATAAKIGEYIDPLSAAFKVSGKAAGSLPKISEVTANIRTGLDATPSQRLHSELELSDGSKVRIEDGQFIRVDADGNPIRDTPRQELRADQRVAQHETPGQREVAGVGAGSRAPGASAHAGDNVPPQVSHEAPAGGSGGSSDTPLGPGGNRTDGAGAANHSAGDGGSSPDTTHAGGGEGNHGSERGGDDGGRPHLVRQDDNFRSEHNHKGQRKSHLNEDGDLVPANPDGDATIVDHIVGRDPAKSDSPFTSLSREGANAKAFGTGKIRVDLPRLERDIAAGRVTGVEVYSPEQVQAAIQESANKIVGRHVDLTVPPGATRADAEQIAESLGLSKGKTKRIAQRMIDMKNTMRDEEWLIKGTVPHDYISRPFGG